MFTMRAGVTWPRDALEFFKSEYGVGQWDAVGLCINGIPSAVAPFAIYFSFNGMDRRLTEFFEAVEECHPALGGKYPKMIMACMSIEMLLIQSNCRSSNGPPLRVRSAHQGPPEHPALRRLRIRHVRRRRGVVHPLRRHLRHAGARRELLRSFGPSHYG